MKVHTVLNTRGRNDGPPAWVALSFLVIAPSLSLFPSGAVVPSFSGSRSFWPGGGVRVRTVRAPQERNDKRSGSLGLWAALSSLRFMGAHFHSRTRSFPLGIGHHESI